MIRPTIWVPLWMHGLVYALRLQNLVEHLHFPWDYDLRNDLAMLEIRRGGPVPFVYMDTLWEDLERRRQLLAREQCEVTKSL